MANQQKKVWENNLEKNNVSYDLKARVWVGLVSSQINVTESLVQVGPFACLCLLSVFGG